MYNKSIRGQNSLDVFKRTTKKDGWERAAPFIYELPLFTIPEPRRFPATVTEKIPFYFMVVLEKNITSKIFLTQKYIYPSFIYGIDTNVIYVVKSINTIRLWKNLKPLK